MIAIDRSVRNPAEWQEGFMAILPEIERLLRIAFPGRDSDAREDAVESGIVHCLLSYVRLFEQGREDAATASSLAWYAKLQIRQGRLPGAVLNSNDVASLYAQLEKRFKVVQLNHWDSQDETWIHDIVDGRQTSVADQVAIKLDFAAWLSSLCCRTRNIATDLARGFSTSEVASKYRLSAGRISQMRRELKNSWQQFQGEPELVTVG